MAVNVIKESPVFEAVCHKCRVTLSYEGIDVKDLRTTGKGKLLYRYIVCPRCQRHVIIEMAHEKFDLSRFGGKSN